VLRTSSKIDQRTPDQARFFTVPGSARGVDSANVGPPFFLLVSAKNVRQHKKSESNGLCLENSIQTGKMALFYLRKKRHFPPFFEDSLRVVGLLGSTLGESSPVRRGDIPVRHRDGRRTGTSAPTELAPDSEPGR